MGDHEEELYGRGRKPPHLFDTYVGVGASLAVKKGPLLTLTIKRLYSQLYEASGANRTIKETIKGSKH